MTIQRVLNLGGHLQSADSGAFVHLPPSGVLSSFLRSYLRNDESRFGLVPGRSLETSELMASASYDNRSGIFVLLAIAQGSAASELAGSKELSHSLTEACCSAFPDIMGDSPRAQGDCRFLHSMLLLQQLAIWSSNPRCVKVSRQRTPCVSSISDFQREDEMLEYQSLHLDPAVDKDASFQLWQTREYRSRLLYAWVLIDLETSLFHDIPPKACAKDIHAALPEAELLWHARSADEWLLAYEQMCGSSDDLILPYTDSLAQAFRKFIDGSASLSPGRSCTLMYLGLLLHPLHALTFHLHHSFDYMFQHSENGSYSVFMASKALSRETGALLRRWLSLYKSSVSEHVSPPATYLIMYHFMSLNNIASFPQIERLLWQGPTTESSSNNSWFRLRWEGDLSQILFHSGRTLRLLQSLAIQELPAWWTVAVYRATLIICASTLSHAPSNNQASPRTVAIDDPALDDDMGSQKLFDDLLVGTPALTKADGSHLPLESPKEVFDHCIAVCTDMGAGAQATPSFFAKLQGLRDLWRPSFF
ncbi:hypothetical protein B0J12DRAFT_573681 [Macrophomina phaseolina]|uniref:Transcription factor domain-containing protein n=1 Tax=Macrophomina phaseolina TaxID=35725 RepID=A0ABQ8GAK9_9PEZI|nr:hypothetical protein B0J12DRAFT_573681 [Macrophomina phaseolina]